MDVEERLRRVRPIGAPPELRDRVLAAASTAPRARKRPADWLWPIGAAAAIVVLSLLAAGERRQAMQDPSTAEHRRSVLLGALTDALAGDAVLARHVVNIEFVEEPPVE